MIEFVAKLIENISRREGDVVRHVCDRIVEAWTNWEVGPYASVVLSDELVELPRESVALDVACDAIEIMRSENPRSAVSDLLEALSLVLDLEDCWEHIDQRLLSGLSKSTRALKFADLESVPSNRAFSRNEYIKLVSKGG